MSLSATVLSDVPRPTLPPRGTPFPTKARPDDPWDGVLDRLDIALQPIVNIHTGACYGYEALLRNHEEAGFASIDDVFDTGHALGLLSDIEMCVREKAAAKFRQMPHWRQTKLFINIDNRSLAADDDLPVRTRAMLDRHGIEESQVVFEVSERHPIGVPATARIALGHYKKANFRLAIDDFGTGFSGLQLLYFSAPDVLKIDRFFISDIASDSKKKLFLGQIVNIAHLLGVVVLAEGVETEREYFVCKDIGCDLIQGWLVQKPTRRAQDLLPHYGEVERLGRAERRAPVSDQKLIADQITQVEPIMQDCPMEQVFERFRSDKTVTFFPVIDAAGEPVGIVREAELKDYTYSQYGKALIANKTIGRRLKDFVVRCPIADINTKAEQILQVYSAVENSEGILIVDTMKYVGFLSAHSLLRVINEKNLAAARDQNPLTRLPGNNLIHEYLSEALAATDTPFVLAYFDFDNFKPFNDKYGFRLGDRAITLFAELLTKAMPRDCGFPGHVGGDDFFAAFRGLPPDEAVAVTARLIAAFARDVESFYDDATRKQGHIDGTDRQGNSLRFPLMTVSAAVIHLPAGRAACSVDDVGQQIAVLKKQAKQSASRQAIGTLG
ncbi:bifunctional diguanylate cyclase/phosphodiesterase [Magnetospirillum moscoviense]|uniref:bifunctional diguanylate cyclase/phosphodiesterase n=1 Tax=Magnetospirillum moscoviense TaxID=1437059 RepID=UPI0009EDF8B7|nr:bifunctional diguanylate cyclase/phosphodiesterase [Magnetospirillum moscoviense]